MIETEDKHKGTMPGGQGAAGRKHRGQGSPTKGEVLALPQMVREGSSDLRWVLKNQ